MGNDKQTDQHNGNSLIKASNFADGNERYRTLIENIPGAVYRCAVDKHWAMVFISAAIQTISGFKADDFINNRIRSYSSIIHPDDVEMVKEKIQAAVEAMVPFVLHYRIVDAQEEIRWVYDKGRAFYGRDNVPLWLDGVIFDYTEQHSARQTLETEHAQLLSIFDSMDEVIYIADPNNYNLLYGNEVFRKNWGDHIGQKCYLALQGRDSPCPFCSNDMIFGKNLGNTYIWEFQNEVNQRWYRCIDRAIKWTDGSMVRFEMAIDNHDLKMAQIKLDGYREQLEKLVEKRTLQLDIAKKQAETANAAKSDFLARMSHEIRTPLNAVTGLTNIVLKSALTTDQRDYLNKVQLAGNSLLQVINDILDFSKVEAGQLDLEQHPFQLDQLMKQLADLFGEQVAQKDVDLAFDLDTNAPRYLMGDSARLAQVLINLITNAVKFTKAGEIVVGVEPADQADKTDHQTGQTRLNFSVRDTGIGIPSDVIPNLFEPFTQAGSYLTRNHEGTGLGLAICRQLVQLMGGRIWVESTPGKGSTFFFTVMLGIRMDLPETTAQRRAHEPDALPVQLLAGHRVLVVEDNELNRDVAVALLEEAGLVAEVAENGSIAVAKVTKSPWRYYDTVLMDIQMPVMDGYEATKKIRAFEKQQYVNAGQPEGKIPIIALTAHALKGEKEKCIAADLDDYLPKPLDEKDLHRALLKWIAPNHGW